MNDSTLLARQVVSALLDAGVRDVVISPGSRNAPLSFALLAAERAGLVRLHTRVDERSAGFTALGLARTSRRPVAVCCTSGTAVANLAPAVLEARHSAVPLLAVTADRPLRLRSTTANQTTVHVGLLPAPAVDLTVGDDVVAALAGLLATGGPGHVNVQLDDPLTPDDEWTPPTPAAVDGPTGSTWPPTGPPSTVPAPAYGPRTVVVAGDDAGPAARSLAEAAGWPLLAEPSSGARSGAHAIRTYRLLLGTELGDRIERVVLLGHPTLSRPVSRLLARTDVEVVEADERWAPRPFPTVALLAAPDAADGPDPEAGDWLSAWQQADRSLSRQVDAHVAAEEGVTPYEVAAAVTRALGDDDLLVVGPSNPVRDLDLMVPGRRSGHGPQVVANRGLAGIDGMVSTAIGAALGSSAPRALALVGDVTFLHDSNGLVLGPGEPRPDLTIVVVNDDGGSIFAVLEQGAEAYADSFERLFGTPHGVDLAALCAATRTPHWRVESLAELEHALAQPAGGIEVVEVRVRRDNRRALDEAIRALRP